MKNLIAGALMTCLVSASAATSALAQDLTHKAPPQAIPVAITNATIHTISGEEIENGFITFENGRIVEIGRGERAFTGRHRVIDAKGKHVYPGLISANTVLGLMEVGSVRATIDISETGDVTPEVRAAVAVNPDSTIIPVTRSNGILTAAVLPSSGAIPGRVSVIRLDGWTWEDMTVESDSGLLVNWPNVRPINSRWMRRTPEEQLEQARENLKKIDEAFDAAAAYLAARKADPTLPTDIRWEAMRPSLEGTKPVYISAQEFEQIQSAVSWAADRNLNAVIVGGRDARLCLDILKRHNVAVILTGTHNIPRRDDAAYDEPFTLPNALDQAGIRWCLAANGGSFQTPHERNLPYHAATAVAYGLNRHAALRAITLSAAELLGVADRLGSLDAGKAATLIVTDGDPLEITTHVEMAFIDGREIDLTNKQTHLADKYREKYRQLEENPSETPASGSGSGPATSSRP